MDYLQAALYIAAFICLAIAVVCLCIAVVSAP